MKPSTDQLNALSAQLDQLPAAEWLSLVRWMIDKVVSEEPCFAIHILTKEAERRRERHNRISSPDKEVSFVDCLQEVMRDVGVRMAVKPTPPPRPDCCGSR